jgi:hypothetical protein
MSIDAVVIIAAIILTIAVLAIIAMIVYYWIRTTYGLCTSDMTANQSMLILENLNIKSANFTLTSLIHWNVLTPLISHLHRPYVVCPFSIYGF